MEEQSRALLAVAARLADYPSDSYREELEEVRSFVSGYFPLGPLRLALSGVVDELCQLPLREAREWYVSAFDLKDKTGLYLTAHELGDSRKRGEALVELKELLRSSGYDVQEGSLPDYLPMLYEWASEVSDDDGLEELTGRLAYATHRIRSNLPEDNPFRPVFEVLMTVVFKEPSDSAVQELERKREKPDLDPMPYPLMYQ